MKKKLKDIAVTVFMIAVCVTALILTGCTTLKASLPDDVQILAQRLWTDTQAKKAECYYEDPVNGIVFWVILNDPNSSIAPGSLMLKEPNSGLELGIEAE